MVEICESIELLNDERWGHRNQQISGWGPSCNSQSSKEWTLSRTREAAILLVKLPIFIDVLSLQFNSRISCFSSKSQSSVDGLLLNIFTSYPRFNYIWKRGGDRIRTPGFAIKIIQKFPFWASASGSPWNTVSPMQFGGPQILTFLWRSYMATEK